MNEFRRERSQLVSREETQRRLKRLREVLKTNIPTHDHKNGAEQCPTCGKHTWTDGKHNPAHCQLCKALGEETYKFITEPGV